MKKRIFSLLLCLVMAAGLLPVAARAAEGTGTEQNPYVATTYAELKDLMANAPTDGTVRYIKLGGDILSEDIQNDYALTLVHKNQNVVLDLAGHTITRSSTITLDSGVIRAKEGTLTINDSVGTGGVYAKGKIPAVIGLTSTTAIGDDDGTVIINGGTYENDYVWGDAVYNEAAYLYINGGTFKARRNALYAPAGLTYVYGGEFHALTGDDAVYLGADQYIRLYNLTAYGNVALNDARSNVWSYIWENTEVFIDGKKQTPGNTYILEGKKIEIRTEMADMIWITADTPETGEELVFSVDIPYGAEYEIVVKNGHQAMAWMVDGQPVDAGTCEANTAYTLRVYVRVNAPVTMDFGAWVNGQPAKLEFVRETMEGYQFYWVEYTFPATADRGEKDVIRLAGQNRWATSLLVADEMKAKLRVNKFSAIIVASGNDFADALAGSYLSAVKSAPILLSGGYGGKFAVLDEENIAYIRKNLASGGTVYILGGRNAVPELYEVELADYTVCRLGGSDRFETNLLILEEAGVPEGSEILVCTATNFADSLSASAAGKPILLVFNEYGMLYGRQPEYLAGLKDCSFTVIGGESAVSPELANALKTYGTAVNRLAGSNRFETSVMVAERYFDAPKSAVLAYAWNYPDGLCGGALAYSMNAPLILTMTGYEDAAAAYIQGSGICDGLVLGGTGLISDPAVRKVFDMTENDPIAVK